MLVNERSAHLALMELRLEEIERAMREDLESDHPYTEEPYARAYLNAMLAEMSGFGERLFDNDQARIAGAKQAIAYFLER